MKKKTLLVAFGVLCLLTSCSPETIGEQNCIEPETIFAYRADGEVPRYPGSEIHPANPWVQVASVPLESPQLLAVRRIDDNATELWLWNWLSAPGPSKQLYVYRTDDGSLKAVALDDSLTATKPVEALYVLPNNSVWAVHSRRASSDVSILGKYDETMESIKPVKALEGINGPNADKTIVVMDSRTSVFWFLVPFDHIYSYDPYTDSLVRHMSIKSLDPIDAAIASNGQIYILNNYLTTYQQIVEQTDLLYLYSPSTESIDNVFYRLEENIYQKNLFVDHAGRLWTGSLGWLEPSGIWYQTIRSPLFVTTNLEGGGARVYRWQPPRIELESPDNTYWFSGPNGLFSLDFQKGEWCWVSTIISEIAHDAGGNLWIIGDGKVYRRPALP